jgi:hypothetical protein
MEMVECLETLLGRRIDVLTPAGLRGIRLPEVARQIEEASCMSSRVDRDLLAELIERDEFWAAQRL